LLRIIANQESIFAAIIGLTDRLIPIFTATPVAIAEAMTNPNRRVVPVNGIEQLSRVNLFSVESEGARILSGKIYRYKSSTYA